MSVWLRLFIYDGCAYDGCAYDGCAYDGCAYDGCAYDGCAYVSVIGVFCETPLQRRVRDIFLRRL